MFWVLGVTRFKTILGNSKKNEIANKEFDLPIDLLFLILPRLSLKDNIRASAVCKTWHEVAVSVRNRSPRLVYFDIDLSGVSYGFFEPTEKKKTKAMKLPDLSIYASIWYSKDGWLLMEDNHSAKGLFFFNPFTREYIKLPSFIGTIGTEFAFSCAPTNQSCVVCGIDNSAKYHFFIYTWYLGAVEWVTNEFSIPTPLYRYYRSKNIVFSDGLFWFPVGNGLGVFDPTARTWDTLHVPLPDLSPFRRWVTEYDGNIYLVDVSKRRRQLIVFRFNRMRSVWEKKETFDGLSIFVSDESSIMTNGLTGEMRNIVYVLDSNLNPDRPNNYSLYTRSFCTDPEGYCLESSTNNEMHYGAWIEPPRTSSIYDF